MFSNLNWWEITVLALIALFIFGPERLPKVISDGVRMLRTVRDMARNATSDLSRELGTEIQLEDLHPKTFIRKHLISEEDEKALRRPFDEAVKEVKKLSSDVNQTARDFGQVVTPADRAGRGAHPLPSGVGQAGASSDSSTQAQASRAQSQQAQSPQVQSPQAQPPQALNQPSPTQQARHPGGEAGDARPITAAYDEDAT